MNTPTAVPAAVTCIGLDISQDRLDACCLTPDLKRGEKSFDNTPSGYVKLLRWAHALSPATPCHFCLEATGPYSQGVALFLVEHGQMVSVINPARIRFFGLAQGTGNKTDKADARLIALYCQQQHPPQWQAPTPQICQLQALVRRLHALSDLVVQEKNRLQVPGQDKAIVASSKRVMKSLEGEMQRLRMAIRTHLKAHDTLRQNAKLLQSIAGIGEITAWHILAEMPEVHQFESAQSLAAYAGLAPREYKSGSSVRKATHLSKQGNTVCAKPSTFLR